MPEGEWAFLDSKGPRKTVALRITPETHLLLTVAGLMCGSSATGIATDVIERWARSFLTESQDQISELVKAERERRGDA